MLTKVNGVVITSSFFLKFKACNDAKIPLVHEFTAIAFFTLSFFLTSSSNLCVILPK